MIPSTYKFDIRLIQTEDQLLYAYQLFSNKPIIRWDNAPHYPKIKTYPHHFHAIDGTVINPELTGNVLEDLEKILHIIKATIIIDSES